jgi:hypothetical protein
MKQAWHIFAKDVRHFWPEIAATVTIAALFAWIGQFEWISATTFGVGGNARALQGVAGLLTGLLPVSWWILITRVVQGERLVGDRQWWITKPYEWRQLLAAKAMFMAVFVVAPFVVAQCVLLEEAGFRWFDYLPGLGFNLALVIGLMMVPAVALATVTSGFGKTMLAAMGCVILFTVVAVFAVMTETGGMTPYTNHISMLVILCFCAGAVVLQYARRMAGRSRLLLAAGLVLVGAVQFMLSSPAAIAKAYPEPANAGDRLQVALDPRGGYSPPSLAGNGKVGVAVPLTFSGIADGSAVRVDGVEAAIETQDGKKWASSWIPISGALALAGKSNTGLSIQMGRRFFNEAQSQRVTLRMKLALTMLEAGEDQRIVMTGSDFAVRGVGICSLEGGESAPIAEMQKVTCRMAMREPQLTYVSVRWAEVPCATGPDEIAGTGSEGTTIGDLSTDPAEFGLSSVRVSVAYMGNSSVETERDGRILHTERFVCQGTPIHFTRYTLAGRREYDVTLENFKMPDWQRYPGHGQ